MKPGYRTAALAIVFALGTVASVHAAKAPYLISNAPFTDSSTPGTVPFATLLSTGFEPPTFVVGPLEPQNGYTASGTNSPWVTVAATNPAAGVQHMHMIADVTQGPGVNRVALTPLVPVAANSPSTTTQMIYITNDQGADYDFIGQAPSQALVAWRVKFSWTDAAGGGPGTIFVLDDVGGLQFVDTGVTWDQGVYRELKVQFDPANSQIRYYYDGNLIYTGVTIYAANTVEQVVWVHDNFQLAGESADVDGLILTDTPNDPVSARAASWGQVKARYR